MYVDFSMTDNDLMVGDDRKEVFRAAADDQWVAKHQEDVDPVQNVIASSFNCYTFEFVSRCWACRSLTPFDSYGILRRSRRGQVLVRMSLRARMS